MNCNDTCKCWLYIGIAALMVAAVSSVVIAFKVVEIANDSNRVVGILQELEINESP